MKWGNERQSENVEDRRGMPMGGIGLAGGGIGTIVIVVLALIFGIDPRELLQQAPTSQSVPQSSGPSQGAAAQNARGLAYRGCLHSSSRVLFGVGRPGDGDDRAGPVTRKRGRGGAHERQRSR